MTFNRPLLVLIGALLFGGVALAATDRELQDAANARLSHMNLQAYNLGIIAKMVQGRNDYDAALALAAAESLASLARADWQVYLLPGTAAGQLETSRAAPVIWESPDDFAARKQAFADAADLMVEAAGQDLDAIRTTLSAVTESCGQCHRTYRSIP